MPTASRGAVRMGAGAHRLPRGPWAALPSSLAPTQASHGRRCLCFLAEREGVAR